MWKDHRGSVGWDSPERCHSRKDIATTECFHREAEWLLGIPVDNDLALSQSGTKCAVSEADIRNILPAGI